MRANQWTVELNAVVVMPDHVHMVFVPKIDMQKLEVFSLARITKAIKGASAHLINRELGRVGRIWQEESFDRVLRISEKLDEKIAYILNNPVRKGLAQSPQEYRWLWAAPGYGRAALGWAGEDTCPYAGRIFRLEKCLYASATFPNSAGQARTRAPTQVPLSSNQSNLPVMLQRVV